MKRAEYLAAHKRSLFERREAIRRAISAAIESRGEPLHIDDARRLVGASRNTIKACIREAGPLVIERHLISIAADEPTKGAPELPL